MVRVVYDIEGEVEEEEVVEPNLLLTNKRGGYFLDYKSTKFRGMFTAYKKGSELSLAKSVDMISICNVPTEIINKLWGFEKKHYKETAEKFFFYNNSLLYEVENYDGTALLTLDVRDIYDFDTQGKSYEITKENEFIVIKFTKGDFARYIIIKTSAPYKQQDKWSEHSFEFDKKRSDAPFLWYVYEAIVFRIEEKARIVITSSDSKEKAMSEANYVYYGATHLKSQKEEYTKSFLKRKTVSRKINTAYRCSLKALDDLMVEIENFKGLYAGLPWFFQIWTRDEAISLGALIKERRYGVAKSIILRQSSSILPDGRVTNRIPKAELGSADGVGWVFRRFKDLFYEQKKEKGKERIFSQEELARVNDNLKDSLEKMLSYYIKQGITLNRKKETWMDTDFGNDTREGARIEIQALTLCMVGIAKEICGILNDPDYRKYSSIEKEIKEKVKGIFYKDGMLFDGYNDQTIRPNIFLAYYIYPELLKNGEWEDIFKKALEALWLDWGGLSTIDKKNPLFCGEYTGMDDRSYHRGDSWYWINNLAAICLYRINKEMFSNYIAKIVEASTEEILRMGALGCHSELSSAKEQRSEGAVSQAWSSAMYIEMINELFG